MGSGLVFCLFFIAKADGMSIKIKRQKTRLDPIAVIIFRFIQRIKGRAFILD